VRTLNNFPRKGKVLAVAVVGIIVISALVAVIVAFTKGPGFGGGSGVPNSASGAPTATEVGRSTSAGMLTVTIEGEQYILEGNTRSLEEVLSAAANAPQSETGPQVLVKIKGNARVKAVEELDKELARRGIRYLKEEDF
jgi:hypothetical protein